MKIWRRLRRATRVLVGNLVPLHQHGGRLKGRNMYEYISLATVLDVYVN